MSAKYQAKRLRMPTLPKAIELNDLSKKYISHMILIPVCYNVYNVVSDIANLCDPIVQS